MTDFTTLKKINVNDHIEKKGNLSYLSWAWAVDQLLTQDPKATWTYADPKLFGDTMMVFCTVTAFDKAMTAQLPVMDYRNKAIPNPDAMAVNTAMQRCLAKAIALHGIGLYIYAGEDLPQDDDRDLTKGKVPPPKESAKSIAKDVWDSLDAEEQNFLGDISVEMIAALNDNDVKEAHRLFYLNNLDQEQQTALWSRFDSKQRRTLKDYNDTIKKAS